MLQRHEHNNRLSLTFHGRFAMESKNRRFSSIFLVYPIDECKRCLPEHIFHSENSSQSHTTHTKNHQRFSVIIKRIYIYIRVPTILIKQVANLPIFHSQYPFSVGADGVKSENEFILIQCSVKFLIHLYAAVHQSLAFGIYENFMTNYSARIVLKSIRIATWCMWLVIILSAPTKLEYFHIGFIAHVAKILPPPQLTIDTDTNFQWNLILYKLALLKFRM